MNGFDPVELYWHEEKFIIPKNEVLGAIARVEEVITLNELQNYGKKNTVPMAKMSMAYGLLLRYAGCKVTDVEVYEAMFGQGKGVKSDVIAKTIVTLIAMMIPPSAMKTKEPPQQGNPLAAAVKKSRKKHSS